MDTYKIIQIALGITGIINCLFIAFFLFSLKNGIIKANRILAAISLSICLKISFTLLINIEHVWHFPSLLLYFTSEAAYFCFGPLIFLYFHVLLKRSLNPITTVFIFLPALSPYIGYILNYDIPLWQLQLCLFAFLISIVIKFPSVFFNGEKEKPLTSEIFWLKSLYFSFAIIWLVVNLLFINFNLYIAELSVVFTIIVYIDIYWAIKFYWLRKGNEVEVKYKNSRLGLEEVNNIIDGLNELMTKEKLYTDPEITLPKVAKRLGLSPHKLSQAINSSLNMTFNEYINFKRVNDIKYALLLPKYDNIKISSLAFDYGFNTISAFNVAFKKFTNYTPSQYRMEKIQDKH